MNKSVLALAISLAIEEQCQEKPKPVVTLMKGPVERRLIMGGRQCGMTTLRRLWMQVKGMF